MTSILSAAPQVGLVVVSLRHKALRARGLVLGYSLCYNICMNTELKIRKIGNSAGVVLPRELLARLRVAPGDTIYATEAPDGIRLTAGDPGFALKMELAEAIMRDDRDILRVLAK